MLNNLRITSLTACFFLLSFLQTYAQALKRIQFAELHAGVGIINEEVSAGSNYRPILFTSRYAVSISKKHKKNHLFFFHAEPQVNLVIIAHSKSAGTTENDILNPNHPEWEAGL